MNWTEVFSGGLIGSILTLFITKSFDFFSKKQDYTFQFRKLFYERKLNAGEMAVGQLSFLYPSITGFASMLRGLSQQESEEGMNYNQTVMNQFSEKLNEYQNNLDHLTQPTILYFNLKDYFELTALFTEWQSLMDGLEKKEQPISNW